MNKYQLLFKKFITSQHLTTGLNVTMAVIIPAVILYQYDLLGEMLGIPLSAMFVSLSDSAGPPKHRINGIMTAVILNAAMVLIATLSFNYPVLMFIELAVFGLVLSMGAVFGNRAGNIGVLAMITFIIAGAHEGANPWMQALYFLIGGTWYGLFSLTSHSIRPYKAAEQMIGECIIEISDYLSEKAELYKKDFNRDVIYPKLLQQQISIQTLQNDIRELLFKTRVFVKESTNRSRKLMMVFVDSIDFFEQVMTSQQNYRQLHKDFDDTGILDDYYYLLKSISESLHLTGIAIQSGNYKTDKTHYKELIEQAKEKFALLRKERLNHNTVEGFIRLRHILTNIEKLSARLDKIHGYLNQKEKIKGTGALHAPQFISHQEFNINLLWSNINIQSHAFRHAIRVTVALIIGYAVSLFFEIGHSYWILLTIASIMKPAFGVTRQRNLQRIGGTLLGAAIGFCVLYYTTNHNVILIIMLISMAFAYSFLRLQYLVSTVFITLYVLLSFYFLQGALAGAVSDRVIDTVLGGVIAYICSYFILPNWEHEKINEFIKEAVLSSKIYFENVASLFTDKPASLLDYRLSRKEVFLKLANLSDALQRMMSEPKSQQQGVKFYHQFTVTHHILISYIASLSYYANEFNNSKENNDFIPMAEAIKKKFNYLLKLSEQQTENAETVSNFPFNKRIDKLLEQRKLQLQSGQMDTDSTKTLSILKSISDQFGLVYSVINDEIKIINNIQKAA